MADFSDTSKNFTMLEEMIENNDLSGTDVLQLFTDYHGLDLIREDFMEFVEDEGYDLED